MSKITVNRIRKQAFVDLCNLKDEYNWRNFKDEKRPKEYDLFNKMTVFYNGSDICGELTIDNILPCDAKGNPDSMIRIYSIINKNLF